MILLVVIKKDNPAEKFTEKYSLLIESQIVNVPKGRERERERKVFEIGSF